ncbi:hypothetical protein V1L54_27360 [Streptomyces sp. TRM 70361]|uniref:hypothetical protein n=1 Tax=Streptomyces sp. TRM 70361 TaxID=3116553 RepID=UPI002E7BF82F|nr:hypothetical protein [Streptomyces sp. TRM 70361]MEE1943080.1 hypothetical protein [Streptomyces sp. TRM 70361]
MVPAIAAAAERQTRALLEQRAAAFADGQAAMEQPHNRARRTTASVETSRTRALRRLAVERAGLIDANVPHRLGRTA